MGLTQGYLLSPMLFNVVSEYVRRCCVRDYPGVSREGGIPMVSALPALESQGAVQMVLWWSQEETLFADDIMMEGLSATCTTAAAGTFIRCVNEHSGICVHLSDGLVSRGVWRMARWMRTR